MLVSIITVSYNSEKTIRDTIESVLNQTYPAVEYILVDGLSTDRTVEIAKEYEARFKEKGRLYTIISEKDMGIYDAMNKGLGLATGKLIGIINSDDWYETNAIERVVESYTESKFDYFYADLRLVKGQVIKIKKARIRKYTTSRNWNHPTSFLTKELRQKYPFKTSGLYGDFDLWLRVRKNGHKIVVLNEVLANFRFGGVSYDKSLQKFIERIKERSRIYNDNGYSRWYLFECFFVEFVKLLIS